MTKKNFIFSQAKISILFNLVIQIFRRTKNNYPFSKEK